MPSKTSCDSWRFGGLASEKDFEPHAGDAVHIVAGIASMIQDRRDHCAFFRQCLTLNAVASCFSSTPAVSASMLLSGLFKGCVWAGAKSDRPFMSRVIIIPRSRAACNMGPEGLISKRRDRPYRGGRSKDWVMVKNRKHPAMARVKDAFSCPAVRQDDR